MAAADEKAAEAEAIKSGGGVTVKATVTAEPTAPPSDPETTNAKTAEEKPPIVTRHEIRIGERTLRYTVTTGTLPIVSDKSGKEEARIFFIAYTLDRETERAEADTTRPLMFSFNGGPGSSSVWLHLGALGPKRVQMKDDGSLPPPPYRMVDNEHTWLDKTDLVFIDPVGTGFSRATDEETGKKFWGVQGDIESVGEFIRLYLTRCGRWSSPLFLVGESYGTTRAAGLAGHLIDRGIAFNGIVLVSSILNFQTARFTPGNDLPYVLFLPTYTATAWYHHRLPDDLQRDLQATLREVEQWAASDYTIALAKGNALSDDERGDVLHRLSRYTGLSETFLDNSDLRIEIMRFCKELLRDQKRTVGRLDSRITGRDASAITERPEFDPSMSAIRPPYTAVFNDYARRQLGYESDLPYYILGGGIHGGWKWDSDNSFADTADALRAAFAKNPYMKLFVASGYYDLATPYFATQYTLSHMGLDPEARKQIVTGEYPAGHMMYIEGGSLAKLKTDVAAFLDLALSHPE